jgi:uncharacterized membrane protein
VAVSPETFNDDYLYFYAEAVGAERSDADAELIAPRSGRPCVAQVTAATRPMLHWVFVFSLITAAGAAILMDGVPVISSAAALGAVGAGLLYAIGDALFFRAVAAWQVSLVTPIVACSGAVNVLLAVMSGDTVGAATAGGLALMVVGVVAVAARDLPKGDAGSNRSRPLWPIGLAAGAAVAFGLVFFVSEKTAGGEAPWLVAIARAGALPLVAALCVGSRQGFVVPSGAWRWVIGAGDY